MVNSVHGQAIDQPAPGLLQHQGEFGQAQTEAIRGFRSEDAEPAKVARLLQTCGRKARVLCAIPALFHELAHSQLLHASAPGAIDVSPWLADIDRDDPVVASGSNQPRHQMCTDEACASCDHDRGHLRGT